MTLAAVVFATAVSAAPVKLAAPGFRSVNVHIQRALFYSDEFTNRMREQGLEVVTGKDIETMLGLERQKELLGCSEGSCIAELADALGADAVITGSIGLFKGEYRVLISVVSSHSAAPLASYSQTVDDDKEVLAALADAAHQMAPQILAALHREPVQISVTPPPKRGPWGFVATGGALGFAGFSAGLFVAASSYDSFLRCDPGQPCAATQQQAQAAHDDGQLMQNLALGSLVAAAICAGLAIWLFVRD